MRLFKEFRSPKVQTILSTFKNKSKYSARVFRNSTMIENETWTKMSAILPWVNEEKELAEGARVVKRRGGPEDQ